jgi:uncharacterized protein YciI
MPMKRRHACSDFTRDEWQMLQRLHLRYQQDHDLLTAHEVAHLRFLRWLAVTGRLVDDGGPAPTGESVEAATP